MMILFLILAGAMLYLTGKYYEKRWTRGLEAHIRFADRAVYAGGETKVLEEIINAKRLSLPEIEAGFRLGRGVSFPDAENIVVSDYVYKRDIFSLRGMESVKRTYRLACHERGRYRISRITLRGWSFFHERQYEYPVPEKQELLVYAGQTDVSNILFLRDTLAGDIRARKTLLEDPFSFAGIRQYQPTDPMKRINWKATAKSAQMMVNTYESVRQEQTLIFLDITDERIVKETDLVEAGIKAAASLCRRMIHAGQEVGLAVNTDPPAVFEPLRGAQQLARIEYFLTGDMTKTAPDGMWKPFRASARERICIMISKDPDRFLDRNREKLRALMTGSIIVVSPCIRDGAEHLDVKEVSV